MEAGIRDFRERLSDYVRGGEPITLTSKGETLETVHPRGSRYKPGDWIMALDAIRADVVARGIDPDKLLEELDIEDA